MSSQTWLFLILLWVLSAGISLLIKVGADYIEIPQTLPMIVTLMTGPSLLVAASLAWRWYQNQPRDTPPSDQNK